MVAVHVAYSSAIQYISVSSIDSLISQFNVVDKNGGQFVFTVTKNRGTRMNLFLAYSTYKLLRDDLVVL